ncbi:hypothetical protein NPIL_546911 [Nephila pilipes]|uniref:Uncharacterized protein n=1 Tax=Nephila pilipes TaxID=299642 RepID=A0A8X6UN76_NEPPI|nr:hypothetical protein NPIL_546911 [Nephila pilipes]
MSCTASFPCKDFEVRECESHMSINPGLMLAEELLNRICCTDVMSRSPFIISNNFMNSRNGFLAITIISCLGLDRSDTNVHFDENFSLLVHSCLF